MEALKLALDTFVLLTGVRRAAWSLVFVTLLAGCAHYPPPFAPARGQSAAQQDADARECDRQVHSGASTFFTGVFTAWSEKERDGYTACMQGRGYTVSR
jgi:hypothetical protein